MRDREKPVYVANYDSNNIDDAFFRFLIVPSSHRNANLL